MPHIHTWCKSPNTYIIHDATTLLIKIYYLDDMPYLTLMTAIHLNSWKGSCLPFCSSDFAVIFKVECFHIVSWCRISAAHQVNHDTNLLPVIHCEIFFTVLFFSAFHNFSSPVPLSNNIKIKIGISNPKTKTSDFSVSTFEKLSVCYFQLNIEFKCLYLCCYLHFTQCGNFLETGQLSGSNIKDQVVLWKTQCFWSLTHTLD